MTMEREHHRASPPECGASDAEVESVMKLLMAYQKAHSEGVAPENPELEALLSTMKTNASLDENITLPSEGTIPEEVPTSEEILPKAFFVVKTTNEKKQKVFINVCGSHKIGVPDYGDNAPTQIDELMASFENAGSNEGSTTPDVRFPLSCLAPVTSNDKKGNPCWVYDVCYNRTVVENAMTIKRLKLFLIDMALTWLSQKYKTQLSSDFKLPNAKYKGKEVGWHVIRVDPSKGPLVTEIADSQDVDPSFPLIAQSKTREKTTTIPSVGALSSFNIPHSNSQEDIWSTSTREHDGSFPQADVAHAISSNIEVPLATSSQIAQYTTPQDQPISIPYDFDFTKPPIETNEQVIVMNSLCKGIGAFHAVGGMMQHLTVLHLKIWLN